MDLVLDEFERLRIKTSVPTIAPTSTAAATATPAINPLFLVIGDFEGFIEVEVGLVEGFVEGELWSFVEMDDGDKVCVWIGEDNDIAV